MRLLQVIMFLILLPKLGSPVSAQPQSDSAQPLETGCPAKPLKRDENLKEVTVVSYNIRWRTGAELDQIASWLTSRKAGIIALQEVDRARQRTGKTNNARLLAEKLGMCYAWAAPPPAKDDKSKEEETGVELLSAYPLTHVKRIVLPNEGPGGRWRVALGATVNLEKTSVRVYSVHSETRIKIAQKLEQYRAVLNDLAGFPKSTPVIIMGDFNSWEPATVEAVRKLFTQEGFTTPFADGDSTFKRKVILFDVTLKLDWIWVRGLTAGDHGIDRSVTVSDHFPLWTAVSGERLSQ